MKKIKLFICGVLIALIFIPLLTKAYTEEELKDGITIEESIVTINQGYDYFPHKMIFGEDEYAIIGYANTIRTEENLGKYPYIAYYNDDEIKWYKSDFLQENGEYVDGIIKDKELIIVGKNKIKGQKKSFICKYSFDGSLLKTKTFDSEKDVEVINIYAKNEAYYVVGQTNSNNFFGKTTTNMEAFVLKLNANLDVVDACFFGNRGDNVLLDSAFYDDEICLLMEIAEGGFYPYNYLKPYIIITCSLRMELSVYETVDNGYADKLVTDKEYLYVFSYDKVSNYLTRVRYEEGINKPLKMTFYSLDLSFVETNIDYLYNEESDLWLVASDYYSSKRIKEYYIRNAKDEILACFKSNNTDNSYITSRYFYHGNIYELGQIRRYDSWELYLLKVNYVVLKNGICYFNGIPSETKTAEQGEEVYGYYDGKITYILNDKSIESYGKVYVPLKINIVNNSTYQPGIKLEFNGSGDLNGKAIESGYVVDEIGNYVLEIKGCDTTTYYHFLVKDMIDSEDKVTIKKLDYTLLDEENEINSSYTSIPKTEKGSKTIIIIAVIAFASLGLGLSFLSLKKKYD